MHVHTHQALGRLIYDALPRAAQGFLRMSDVEINYYARIPDEVDKDNLLTTGSDKTVEAWSHSYKMDRQADGTLKHVAGSVHLILGGAPHTIVTSIREGRPDVAREATVKAFAHYAVDLSTPYHLTHELTPEMHEAGEEQIWGHLDELLPDAVHFAAQPLPDPKSLYHSAVLQAQHTYETFVGRMLAAQKKGPLTSDLGLCREIVANAAGFGLAVALELWRWTGKA